MIIAISEVSVVHCYVLLLTLELVFSLIAWILSVGVRLEQIGHLIRYIGKSIFFCNRVLNAGSKFEAMNYAGGFRCIWELSRS